ncbi:MAG: D-2-hydroxyacid dehydrogenase [Candidatus Acidiferrales bacterium]
MAPNIPTKVIRATPAQTKLLICVWHPFNLWRPPEEMGRAVQRRFPEMRVVHLPNYDRLDAELPDTDIFVGYSIRPNQFPWASKLKWIHSTAAGIAQLSYPALRESGVLVTNASGTHSIPIGEHVLGMLLALARRLPDALRYRSEHHWAQQEIWDAQPSPRELHGTVLLLVGLGAVGKEVARLGRAFGMTVRAVTRSGRGDTALAEKIYLAAQLDAALAEADYVVLAAPETADTHHLIGPRQLAAMKPDSYLVNVARGSLIDEAALVAVLETHRIAGAALDVASAEPLPPESPLWRLDNVLITPHLAAASEHLWTRQTNLLIENLERWFDGRELLNRVDFSRGY